jgi:preprotein translocase subunit SecG
MRRRLLTLVPVVIVALLVLAAPAFAGVSNGGQGLYGETNDPNITKVMFILIAFFPTVCLVFSLITARLEKRKHARLDAAKRRSANVDWRGGW